MGNHLNLSLSRRDVVVDLAIAVSFVLLDTAVTLVGGSWWPAHPGRLAWGLLAAQGLTCLSLVARRRAPLAVVGIFAAFTLAVTLLVSPLHALRPANDGNIWAPLGAVVAAYAPVRVADNRRRTIAALAAVALLAVITARPWQPSATIVTFGVLRILFGPLLALYVVTRRRLVQALTERAERAEREQHLLAEQARAEERARLAGEMHDLVTHRVSLMVLQAGGLRVTAPDEPTRKAAEELRAAGFLVKSTPPEDLVRLVRVAADGNMVLSPTAARRLVAASADQQSTRQRAEKLTESLTERELEVLACLGEGLSNAQIAARLYLSEATIKGYVSRMLDKLGCANRTQAGLLAHDAGIVGR